MANLALLKETEATASSLIYGFPTRHEIHFLNDGWYNNCRSWIPMMMPAWVELDLQRLFELSLIAIGSEHTKRWNDRQPLEFTIRARGHLEDEWTLLHQHEAKDGPVRGTTVFAFKPMQARFVRLDFTKTAQGDPVRVDEVEVYGRPLK
jgi:hypothetical protein